MMHMYLLIKPVLTKGNIERMEKIPSIAALCQYGGDLNT
jgi:hypothetical protein